MRSEKILAGISQFCQICEDCNLSVVDLPTAYWQEIISQLDSQNLNFPPSVRLVTILLG